MEAGKNDLLSRITRGEVSESEAEALHESRMQSHELEFQVRESVRIRAMHALETKETKKVP